jgi:PD-(D/E)XK nuclease superfamily
VLKRRIVIVDGLLAYRQRRLQAARGAEMGIEILTLPQLAARCAGGFLQAVHVETLYECISKALAQGGFAELSAVAELPGMIRAVAFTLDRLWRADVPIPSLCKVGSRFKDLALIEARIRALLPGNQRLPQDLRDAAKARSSRPLPFIQQISLEGLLHVDPVWRPLLTSLADVMPLIWEHAHPLKQADWFKGRLDFRPGELPQVLRGELCADPRAEVVEALRWARALLGSGRVKASEIGIATPAPAEWDDHMLVLASDAQLPVHFAHGTPALCTYEGQSCAALADELVHGLSQERLRRVLHRLSSASSVPANWALGIARDAGLFTLEHWRRALTETGRSHESLLGILTLLARGIDAAEEAGDLLSPPAQALWRHAIRIAPPAAVALSLQSLRVPDSSDPGNSIVWGPAQHFATVPRPYMRLLGLCGRGWPRKEGIDPLMPDHLIARSTINLPSTTELDRESFSALLHSNGVELIVSRARRSAAGSLQSRSPLWPQTLAETIQHRLRVPQHAFSESDRVLARPLEARDAPLVRSSRHSWRSRRRASLTPHDGIVREMHPLVEQALARIHSTSSIRRLLRDPLGFIWRYALGWHSVALIQRPLVIGAIAFGELVHEIMRATVDSLEPDPGFAGAPASAIQDATARAADAVFDAWPLQRPVPPALLWRGTVAEAARRCLHGLLHDGPLQPGTRSWTEVPFASTEARINPPWPIEQQVIIDGTDLQLTGRIDRIDITADGRAARISEYKTGETPKNIQNLILGEGREVQRALYAMAARQLLPQLTRTISRLVYLDGASAPAGLSGESLDSAIRELGMYLNFACTQLRAGHLTPGPDAEDKYYENRLAYPADLSSYLNTKRAAFARVQRPLARLWDRR